MLLIDVGLRNLSPCSADTAIEVSLTCTESSGETMPPPATPEKSRGEKEQNSFPKFESNTDAEGNND